MFYAHYMSYLCIFWNYPINKMPKSQLLFSAVFGFRNPSKEIFSGLDETFAQGPIFARSFQKTEEITKWGHEAARGVAGAAQALAAPTYLLGPSCGPPR